MTELEFALEEPEVETEEEEDEEDFYELYVEIATNLIHEVQFFDNFCFVRPASPSMYLNIRKLSLMDFTREFREYYGDVQQLREYLKNSHPDVIIS